MESLFRFVLTRPAETPPESPGPLKLAQNTNFQASLANVIGNRDRMKHLARGFVASANFIGSDSIPGFNAEIAALDLDLDGLEGNKTVSHARVVKAVKDAFGQAPTAIETAGTLTNIIAALKDSLIAIKLLPEEHTRPVQAMSDRLRTLDLISVVAADKDFLGTGRSLFSFRRRPLQLPTDTELISILSTRERQKALADKQKKEEEARRKKAEEKLDLYRRLNAAVAELTALGPNDIRTSPQTGHPGFKLPADFRPVKLLIQDMDLRNTLTRLDVAKAGEAGARETPKTDESAVRFQREILPARGNLLGGSPEFKVVDPGKFGFRLKDSVGAKLSKDTPTVLKERGLDLSEDPLDEMIRTLNAEIDTLSKELDENLGRAMTRTFKRIGGKLVMITTPQESAWNKIVIGATFDAGKYLFPLEPLVPETHGDVAPAGVADLLVVKQQLVRYEGADVAHIENVLKGELKSREHTRRQETEEFSFLEVETTTSEERELESTSRFEMSQEASKTLKEDAAIKGGLQLSGKYGPTVEFSASAEASFTSSKEQATRSASKFSQDVTERSATKITERVLERASLKVTNEVIEKNTHGIDNTNGTAHIAGVYQWVNKIYQAQVFNYGIRMMYDFMVPEPAAFLISSMKGEHANAIEIEKPPAFTLRPDQIYESNYHTWVKNYGATDVVSPPELYVTKSLDHHAGAEKENIRFSHSGQLAIDDGYRAVHATVGCVRTIWEDEAIVDIVIGQRSHRFSEGSPWVWSTSMENETGSVPFAAITLLVGDVGLAAEVKCMRTERAFKEWQHDTHAKLTTAYRARMAEYEETLKALEIQAGVEIAGGNPALNLELMNDELKKHCISILTEQHFDLFDAIEVGGEGVEQIDLVQNEAEGPYVRFFEQAFEWEQMTWLTYPYFWGRKKQWRERLTYEDPDPVFNQFLKAGYCRAVVPVRPGFQGAVDHFMTYGEIWNGGPLPTISNPLYLPIADEISERLNRPGDEIPQGDPWMVRIPTTLVHLRADDKLPVWAQNASGEWVEV